MREKNGHSQSYSEASVVAVARTLSAQYGDLALPYARGLARGFQRAGDIEGQRIWLAIAAALPLAARH